MPRTIHKAAPFRITLPIELDTVQLCRQVKFREFLSTEYGEAQLDFLLEAMKLEQLDAGEQDQAATKVHTYVCLFFS